MCDCFWGWSLSIFIFYFLFRNVLHPGRSRGDGGESAFSKNRSRNASSSSNSSTPSETSSPTSPDVVRLRSPRRVAAQRASYACGESMDASKILEQSPLFRNKIAASIGEQDDSKKESSEQSQISNSTSSINARYLSNDFCGS